MGGRDYGEARGGTEEEVAWAIVEWMDMGGLSPNTGLTELRLMPYRIARQLPSKVGDSN